MKRLNKILNLLSLGDYKKTVFSDISQDIAQIFFASWTIGPIATQQFKLWQFLTGLLLSLGFWYVSLIINKKRKNKSGH